VPAITSKNHHTPSNTKTKSNSETNTKILFNGRMNFNQSIAQECAKKEKEFIGDQEYLVGIGISYDMLLDSFKQRGYTFDEEMLKGLPLDLKLKVLIGSAASQFRSRCHTEHLSKKGGKRRTKKSRKLQKNYKKSRKVQKKRGTRGHA
jgi:hypothetical protein